MNCKDEVVRVDGSCEAYGLIDYALDVVHGVEIEASWIQHGELERESSNTLCHVVIEGLRVETEGPSNEGYPTEDVL